MAISNAAIKKLVEQQTGVKISNSAASAIAKLLEKKASTIAKYSVKRAKDKGRNVVTEDDVDSYRLKFGA